MASGHPRPIAEIQYSAYHHRMWASYKTLEVARIDGRWQVVDVIKHVRNRGVFGF